jgi:hypothetical protein
VALEAMLPCETTLRAVDGPRHNDLGRDDRERAAILRQVLELHPATLTMDELARE